MEQVQGTIRNVTPIREEESLMRKAMGFFFRTAKEKTVYDIQIVFHRQAAGMLEHGRLTVSSREHKLDNRPVSFTFVGLTSAPMLTPDVIYHIWSTAVEAGYIPHQLHSYKALA
jgi:hypothetical protein